jgi:hypothetical protein
LSLQCEYDRAQLSCKNCLNRGVPCRKGKVVEMEEDPLTVRPPLTDTDFGNPSDAQDIRYFYDILFPTFIEEKGRTDGRHAADFLKHRFAWTLSSESIRRAILLYSCYCRKLPTLGRMEPDHQIEANLNVYYRHELDATRKGLHAELVYACYFMSLYGFVSGRPFDEIVHHVHGFLNSFQKAKGSISDVEELFAMKCMCKDIVCWIIKAFGTKRLSDELCPGRTETLFRIALLTTCVFEDDLEIAPSWMRESYSYARIQMLMYRLQISFEYYLTDRNEDNTALDGFGDSIRKILNEIASLTASSPWLSRAMDRIHIFPNSTEPWTNFGEDSEPLPMEREWLLWEPSILARWKDSSLWQAVQEEPEIPLASVTTGMTLCRLITQPANGGTMFEMNTLSALRSLILAGLLLVETHLSEGRPTLMRGYTY